MSRTRRSDGATVVVLIGKLWARWLAAQLLTFPAFHVHRNGVDLTSLDRSAELLTACLLAVLAALWVVLRHKRIQLGIGSVLARTGLLLIVSAAVTTAVLETDPSRAERLLDPVNSGAVLVLLFGWIAGWRAIDRLRSSDPARDGPDPLPGEIWFAFVPYEEGSYAAGEQREKDRMCLVVENRGGHARVLKITSQDKSERRDHIAMPAGWNPESDRPNWIQHDRPIDVPHQDFRRFVTTCPDQLQRRLDRIR